MMLALKMGISYAIPDTPAWVEKEMAKIEYRRRELEKAAANSSQNNSAPVSTANSFDVPEDVAPAATPTPSKESGANGNGSAADGNGSPAVSRSTR